MHPVARLAKDNKVLTQKLPALKEAEIKELYETEVENQTALRRTVYRTLAGYRLQGYTDDVVQDTLLKLLTNLDKYKGQREGFRGWVCSAGRNTARDLAKNAHQRITSTISSLAHDGREGEGEKIPFDIAARGKENPHREAMKKLCFKTFERTLEKFDPVRQEIMGLSVNGAPPREIFEILREARPSITMRTINKHLECGRRELREALARDLSIFSPAALAA